MSGFHKEKIHLLFHRIANGTSMTVEACRNNGTTVILLETKIEDNLIVTHYDMDICKDITCAITKYAAQQQVLFGTVIHDSLLHQLDVPHEYA